MGGGADTDDALRRAGAIRSAALAFPLRRRPAALAILMLPLPPIQMKFRNRTALAAAVLAVVLHAAAQTAHAQQPAASVPVPPAEGTYELSAVEELPEIRNRRDIARLVAAGFPAELRGTGTQGSVTLRFRVLTTGRVDPATITVVESAHEAFNEPAVQVAQRMLFRPAGINGRPVSVIVTVPINFFDPDKPAADSVVAAPRAAP
jgi:TonB family protein